MIKVTHKRHLPTSPTNAPTAPPKAPRAPTNAPTNPTPDVGAIDAAADDSKGERSLADIRAELVDYTKMAKDRPQDIVIKNRYNELVLEEQRKRPVVEPLLSTKLRTLEKHRQKCSDEDAALQNLLGTK